MLVATWAARGVENITLGVREWAVPVSEAKIYVLIYILLCFALFHIFNRIYALFYILPSSDREDQNFLQSNLHRNRFIWN